MVSDRTIIKFGSFDPTTGRAKELGLRSGSESYRTRIIILQWNVCHVSPTQRVDQAKYRIYINQRQNFNCAMQD